MSQILKLTHENQQLKRQINQYQQVLGVSPYVNDSLFKGGYRVVKTIVDRDAIKCCWRKQGMKVVVIGEDYSYKEYVLKTSDCNENIWEEISLTVEENEVFLIEDYSELSEDLITQKDLNLVLKDLILNLQSQIDNIELLDEKVQITEDTSFANIGQTQKDFNKNASDYKINSDLKNQEQDDRLTDIEDENAAQNDLINDLQNSFNLKQDKLSSFDESILIENGGNIEANISLFEEYFEQQECELNFTPIQIIAVYQDGIKLLNSEYEIILPKKIKIKEYVDENIQIEYTHLKS